MFQKIRKIIYSIVPSSILKTILPIYHGGLGFLAGIFYGTPGSELTLIGVTGTAGKSTTVMMLAHILNSVNKKTGYITTVGSFDGNRDIMNTQGMSMPGGPTIQKSLHNFITNGCRYAIIEATSEGLAQHRHEGLKFKAALFTNLSPAHLDSHGSFDKYRSAKGKLFQSLDSDSIIGVNTDDPNYQYFLNFPATKKFGITTRQDKLAQTSVPIIKAEHISVSERLQFNIEQTKFELNLKGSFNITNALLAVGLAQYLGVTLQQSADALKSFGTVPGRMETIPNNKGFTIIVDYAPEPGPFEQSLRTVSLLEHNKLICVFGSTGGHRDKAKRFEFGAIAAKFADTIIITNDDVYESDPEEIANHIQQGINQVSSQEKKVSSIIVELDRFNGIKKALEIAQPNDVVLVTGKGSEQFLVLPGNQRIDWDDRKVINDLLK